MTAAAFQRLSPTDYRRIPWKNGAGVLTIIAQQGGETWEGMGIGWHYGRTSIVAEGPFSDLSGYERLQAVIEGQGLVLVTPSGEIDLRAPFQVRRYDGGTPIVTRLENGSVEVANLIADRHKFAIDLRVGRAGDQIACAPGYHIVHAAACEAEVEWQGQNVHLPEGHALRWDSAPATRLIVTSGRVLVASVYPQA